MAAAQDLEPSLRTMLVDGVAQEIVAELAPEEEVIYPVASRKYFEDPEAAVRPPKQGDRVLGFGRELGVFLTPVVLRVLSEVVDMLASIARKSIHDGVSGEVSAVVKGMFAKFRTPEAKPPVVLTREQLALVHNKVVLTAKKLRLPHDQAQSLANAVTARLLLSED